MKLLIKDLLPFQQQSHIIKYYNLKNRNRMNMLINLNLQTSRFAIAQPLLSPTFSAYNHQELCKEIAEQAWPLHNINFYVKLDYATEVWQQSIQKSIQKIAIAHLSQWTHNTSFSQIHEQLQLGIRIMKKMQFYKIGYKNQKLFFGQCGLLQLYALGDLRSIELLTQIEKYTPKDINNQDSQAVEKLEKEVIYRDVSLKIAKNVLNQLKTQLYIPSRDLSIKLFKIYGFIYDFNQTFKNNYLKALIQKGINPTEQQRREAVIIFLTFKIISSLSQLNQVCHYVSYLKNVLLDRSSGVLTGSYQLWALLYQITVKLYSRHCQCRQRGWLEIDQILSSQSQDSQFHSFLMKNISLKDVSLSSINFYLKNSKKEQRMDLKPLIKSKIQSFTIYQFWKNIEDILEFVQNQLDEQQKKKEIHLIINRITSIFQTQITKSTSYIFENGLTFILQNIIKYICSFGQILTHQYINKTKTLLSNFDSNNPLTCLQTSIVMRYFDSLLAAVYNETDYTLWKSQHIACYLQLSQSFYKNGFVVCKSTLKLIYNRLSEKQPAIQIWERLLSLIAEHYFCGNYEQNSDLELIHSHETYSQVIASKILQYFQRLRESQQIQAKEMINFLEQNSQDYIKKKSYVAIRGMRDQSTFIAIQNICLIFSSQLSMQTLDFSLNYCTPYIQLPAWQPHQQTVSILSLICEQMPIEVLKFAYNELCSSQAFSDWNGLDKLPSGMWSILYGEIDPNTFFSTQNDLQGDVVGKLKNLRRFQFVINISNCVFDKLNQQSQKNIKQIKMIFQEGVKIAQKIVLQLTPSFIQLTSKYLLNQVQKLSSDQVSELTFTNEQDSFMAQTYISKNHFLQSLNLFKEIGKITQSNKIASLQKIITPTFPHVKNSNELHEQQKLICRYIQLISTIESTWGGHTTQIKAVFFSKEWIKQLTLLLQTLKSTIEELKIKQKNIFSSLTQKLNGHIKMLFSKFLLPCALNQLLLGDDKTLTKSIVTMMRAAIFLLNFIDSNYEQHFIVQVQTLQDILKEPSKGITMQNGQILNLLQLFIDLIFSGIRIRSYHLYRIIKHYQRQTSQPPALFNAVISKYIRILFEQFITNYKPTVELSKLSANCKSLTASYHKLSKYQVKFSTIQSACSLSMFINLFCRLNYGSLAAGVEKLFGDEQAKAMYLDYLSALTRKIAIQNISIEQKDKDILKVDVYGNLTIIAKGKLSQRLLNKIISLAKNLLRVKTDIKGINQLPIKLLTQKIEKDYIPLNLQDFQDEWKAISLGALSLHRRIVPLINSNLHYCNIIYLSCRNFQQNIDINKRILPGTRQEVQNEVRKIGKLGIQGLKVQIHKSIKQMLDNLLAKVERYFELCGKQIEYAQKLYASFKILCINCLNTPQIVSYVLSKSLNIHNNTYSFIQFIVHSLKICLPLACQFLAVIAKINWDFELINGQYIPMNFLVEIKLKKQLIRLLQQQIQSKQPQYQFLSIALHFIQRFMPQNRFKYYRFANINNDHYQSLVKQADLQFNYQILNTFQKCIQQNNQEELFTHMIQLFSVALQEYHQNDINIDFKRLQTEQKLRAQFMGEVKKEQCKQHRMCSFKKLNSLNIQHPIFYTKNSQPIYHKDMFQKVYNYEFVDNMDKKITFQPKIQAKILKRLTGYSIEEDIIGFYQSKFIINECENLKKQHINQTIIEKFKFFNDQLQGKEFLKGVTAYPTQEGINLIRLIPETHQQPNNPSDYENQYQGPLKEEDGIIQEDETQEIVQSFKQLDNENEQEFKISNKLIEQNQSLQNFTINYNTPKGINRIQGQSQGILISDKIIYSQIELNEGDDGSMKLFADQQCIDDPRSLHQTVTKDDILCLIEDYTLNPEAIKQIVLRIKYLPSQELQQLCLQQSGEILFVIETQLRNRGIFNQKLPKTYNQDFFIDEGKMYEKIKNRGDNQKKELKVSSITLSFATEWIVQLLKKNSIDKRSQEKKTCQFIKILLIKQKNVKTMVSAALQILTTNDQEFEQKYKLAYSVDKKSTYYKQLLIDSLFSTFIYLRIGLTLIFFGFWSQTKEIVSNFSSDQKERIIDILLQTIIKSPQKESLFLTKLLDYIKSLKQTTKFSYPYLDLQDTVPINTAILQGLSQRLRINNQSFRNNQKLSAIFKVVCFLQLKCLKEFWRIEMNKTAHIVQTIYLKQKHIIQNYLKQFQSAQHIEIDRKAEIYWNLRKAKHLTQQQAELVLSRRILQDTVTKTLPEVKENIFAYYFRQEDNQIKHEINYFSRKVGEARNYCEKSEIQKELQDRKKYYQTWKRSSINNILKEEIVPTLQQVSLQFTMQLQQSNEVIADLYEIFGEIKEKHPMIFSACSEFYHLILAYQAIKIQEQQSHYSMSLLKTLPSIRSTNQTSNNPKRRTSISWKNISINQGNTTSFMYLLKRNAKFIPISIMQLNPKDFLMILHAKNADTQTKFKLLKQQNSQGEKMIEVSRQSIWFDTFPHLDEKFGKSDIKIKIKGQLGIDYGGVTKQWAALVVKQITNPNLGLFQLSANELTLQPAKTSYIIPNQLQIFRRLGIFIGKALKQGWLLEINFTKSFLKHLLGADLYVQDLEDIDPDTAKGLIWILRNDIGDDLGLNFTFQEVVLQDKKIIQLVPGGSEVQVNQQNKKQYVKKLAYLKMTENIRQQSMAFMQGLQKVISISLLKLFNYKEISKFLAGHSTIDISQMKKYAKYQGCNEDDTNVKWFWESLNQKPQQDKSQFLFFVSGSYRVPYSGFQEHPITINKLNSSVDYCPIAHTCFNIIDLPNYTSKEKLDIMLTHAIKQGKGFTVS